MPLTKKGKEIMASMIQEYGPEKGKQVFYASQNKGTIEGVTGERKKLEHRTKNRLNKVFKKKG